MFDQFDALLLARIQFAFTISFHFIFPAFSIGLASYLAVLNGLWLWTQKRRYLELFRYWVKIFALAFAITPSEKIDNFFMRLSISTHGIPPYNELCRAPNADCLDTPDQRAPNLL